MFAGYCSAVRPVFARQFATDDPPYAGYAGLLCRVFFLSLCFPQPTRRRVAPLPSPISRPLSARVRSGQPWRRCKLMNGDRNARRAYSSRPSLRSSTSMDASSALSCVQSLANRACTCGSRAWTQRGTIEVDVSGDGTRRLHSATTSLLPSIRRTTIRSRTLLAAWTSSWLGWLSESFSSTTWKNGRRGHQDMSPWNARALVLCSDSSTKHK